MLSDDPEAALQEMAERQAEEIERLRKDDPEQYLQMDLIDLFTGAEFGTKTTSIGASP